MIKDVCAVGLQLAGHVEAGALLCPFGRLYRAVAVEVGAEVAMPADTGVAELLQQLTDEQAQGRTLFGVRVSLARPSASSPPS